MSAVHLRDKDGATVSSGPSSASSAKGSRTLGASSIALISLAAVLTLRAMPSIAEEGWSSIAYYLFGALLFFVPLSLVAAELATGWPRAGGIYAWVKEAFGERSGFLTIWIEWIDTVIWYPTVSVLMGMWRRGGLRHEVALPGPPSAEVPGDAVASSASVAEEFFAL